MRLCSAEGFADRTVMEGIVILGSTGSIGVNTLAVIRQNPGRFSVEGLSGHDNVALLAQQIREFRPKQVAIGEGRGAHLQALIAELRPQPEILEGIAGQCRIAEAPSATRVVAAVVGAAGIKPVMAAIRAGKTIALANKECLVMAGALLMEEARRRAVRILPIDSEHNAIFQALQGAADNSIDHLTLTASGGPFRRKPSAEFGSISLQEALRHPNWQMGQKITIDSATMMNKCLEIIEARWLFDLPAAKIKVLVHPQSVIHSLVTFRDGSTLCQLGLADMRIPIAYCLGFPERIPSGAGWLDLAALGSLTFEEPDPVKFPALRIAYEVLALGGGAPAALNGANETLVGLFLQERIRFTQISDILQALVARLRVIGETGAPDEWQCLQEVRQWEDAIQADAWGRAFALRQATEAVTGTSTRQRSSDGSAETRVPT